MLSMEDTPICYGSHFEHVEKVKKLEQERHQGLLEASVKATAAIKEFLNETGD